MVLLGLVHTVCHNGRNIKDIIKYKDDSKQSIEFDNIILYACTVNMRLYNNICFMQVHSIKDL